ncbi:hypothetical protein [Flavobacterium franklandianum]|nr:hypothetical protein [Flavobacterium franklandianum]
MEKLDFVGIIGSIATIVQLFRTFKKKITKPSTKSSGCDLTRGRY